jgi:hypothetical protein
MPKQLNETSLHQKMAKLTLQDIEENSIDQLIAQPSPGFKETLKNILADNCEEIARLTNLNLKILKCLDRTDQQDQDNVPGVCVVTENTTKVSLNIGLGINYHVLIIFRLHLVGPNCRKRFGFECFRTCQCGV